jgi:hypothetical protein
MGSSRFYPTKEKDTALYKDCHLGPTGRWSDPGPSLLSLSLVQENPEVAMDCTMYLSQHLSPAERAQVVQLLSTVERPAST